MIGVDTNVLVRYLTNDDPAQSPVAKGIVDAAEKRSETIYLNTTVLCELCWILSGPRYRYDRLTIASTLELMLDRGAFVFEQRDLVSAAVAEYKTGSADFADSLIGQKNQDAGCTTSFTFDRSLGGAATFSQADG